MVMRAVVDGCVVQRHVKNEIFCYVAVVFVCIRAWFVVEKDSEMTW